MGEERLADHSGLRLRETVESLRERHAIVVTEGSRLHRRY